jgi:hypothetical protein
MSTKTKLFMARGSNRCFFCALISFMHTNAPIINTHQFVLYFLRHWCKIAFKALVHITYFESIGMYIHVCVINPCNNDDKCNGNNGIVEEHRGGVVVRSTSSFMIVISTCTYICVIVKCTSD